MSFQISNLFNNIINSQNLTGQQLQETEGKESSNQVINAPLNGTTDARMLLTGDTVSGTIMDINDNKILLQLSNGQNISARLEAQINLQKGQNLTFLIKENTSQALALKPVTGEVSQLLFAQKALEAAGLADNESNRALINELVSRNMSIDSDTLNEIIKNTVKFPQTDTGIIADLMKLNIPVTQDNINQYMAYTRFENNLSSDMMQLSDNIQNALSQMTFLDGNISNAGDFLSEITQALFSQTDENIQDSNILSASMNSEELDKLSENIKNAFGEASAEFCEQIKEGNISGKEVLNKISDLIKNNYQIENENLNNNPNLTDPDNFNKNDLIRSNISNLLNSKEMGQLLKNAMTDNMFLTPQMVAKEDSIKDYYTKVKKITEKLTESISKYPEAQQLDKGLNDIKSSIDFMNDFNKNMVFFQMPLKFKESAGNGELYVFSNKKTLKNSSDNISALLHLDMENLGPLDVFVKLSGKNVSTNFTLESDEMLNFIYSHIDELNKRIEALGFTTKCELKVSGKEKFNFSNDFVNKDVPQQKTSQFIFDIKA